MIDCNAEITDEQIVAAYADVYGDDADILLLESGLTSKMIAYVRKELSYDGLEGDAIDNLYDIVGCIHDKVCEFHLDKVE